MMSLRLFCVFAFSCFQPSLSDVITTVLPESIFLGPCPWFEKRDTNTEGGIGTSYPTITECRQACQASSSRCKFGFDWDAHNLAYKCWFSSSNKQSFAEGVSHFSTTCPETTPPSFTTPPMPSTTKSIGVVGKCVWKTYNNTNTFEGVRVSGSSTLEDCRSRCMQRDGCKNGFDFNQYAAPGFMCYLSNDQRLFRAKGIYHHYKYCPIVQTSKPRVSKGSLLSSKIFVFTSTILMTFVCLFLSSSWIQN